MCVCVLLTQGIFPTVNTEHSQIKALPQEDKQWEQLQKYVVTGLCKHSVSTGCSQQIVWWRGFTFKAALSSILGLFHIAKKHKAFFGGLWYFHSQGHLNIFLTSTNSAFSCHWKHPSNRLSKTSGWGWSGWGKAFSYPPHQGVLWKRFRIFLQHCWESVCPESGVIRCCLPLVLPHITLEPGDSY